MNFKGNGLIGEDMKYLLEALEPKFNTLQIINFYGNKIGLKGAEYLAKSLD